MFIYLFINYIFVETKTLKIMGLQSEKEYYLFCILEGWLVMEVNFPNSCESYLPNKRNKYSENLKEITEMKNDSNISYEQFKINFQMLLS